MEDILSKIGIHAREDSWGDFVRAERLSLLAISFGCFHKSSQRFAGIVGIHNGRPALLVSTYGLVICGANMVASQLITEGILYTQDQFLGDEKRTHTRKLQQNDLMMSILRNTIVGVGVFALLEARGFRTAVPSSILDAGVYANTLNGYVKATGAVNSQAQRAAIQKLGMKHGCHHCGVKAATGIRSVWRVVSGQGPEFIADHIPPTKMAEIVNRKLQNRIINRTVPQRLYPQCTSCWHKQGGAVRGNVVELIYHGGIRSHHFALGISKLMEESNFMGLNDVIDPLVVEPVFNIFRSAYLESISQGFWRP